MKLLFQSIAGSLIWGKILILNSGMELRALLMFFLIYTSFPPNRGILLDEALAKPLAYR